MISNTRAYRASKGSKACRKTTGSVREEARDQLNRRLAEAILKGPPGRSMSCREISRKVGCSISTVTATLDSALESVRRGLSARGISRDEFGVYLSLTRQCLR